MQVRDAIKREMVLPANRAAVWAALTTAEGLAGWWCRGLAGEVRAGGDISFDMLQGAYPAHVEVLEPEHRFVFTWRPFQSEEGADRVMHLTTRVEFRVEDHPRGTLLRLRETGFEALPGALSGKTVFENEAGWDEELALLRTFLVTGEHVLPA